MRSLKLAVLFVLLFCGVALADSASHRVMRTFNNVANGGLPLGVSAKPIRLSPHFIANEFRCRCCGELRIDAQLIAKLEELRLLVGKPIIITSGYRCPAHNKEVGGVANSQHMQGKAADIYVNGMSCVDLASKARQVGFSFVKVYRGWIHVDVR